MKELRNGSFIRGQRLRGCPGSGRRRLRRGFGLSAAGLNRPARAPSPGTGRRRPLGRPLGRPPAGVPLPSFASGFGLGRGPRCAVVSLRVIAAERRGLAGRPDASGTGVQASWISVGPDAEALHDAGAEGGGERHVGGVAAAGHQHAALAGDVVARVEQAPGAAEVGLEPGGEVAGRVGRRGADVAEVAGAVARRDVHRAAEGDGEMRVVAADADAFGVAFEGRAGGAGLRCSRSGCGCGRSRRSPAPAPSRARSAPKRLQARSSMRSLSQKRLASRKTSASSGSSSIGCWRASGTTGSGRPLSRITVSVEMRMRAGGGGEAAAPVAEAVAVARQRHRRVEADEVGRLEVGGAARSARSAPRAPASAAGSRSRARSRSAVASRRPRAPRRGARPVPTIGHRRGWNSRPSAARFGRGA